MSKKLLLADDSITIQKVVGITFANEDVDLVIADNGAAALEKALSDPPDLILADVHMPEKNGYELCAQIKKEPSLQRIPVLLLTGTFESFDEDEARSAGADDWIAKPFASQALIEKVQALLDQAAQAPVPAAESREDAAAHTEAPEEDIWGDFAFAEDEMDAQNAAPGSAAESDEDILELDEADILEDDFEEMPPEDEPAFAAAEAPFTFAAPSPIEEEPVAGEPLTFPEEEPTQEPSPAAAGLDPETFAQPLEAPGPAHEEPVEELAARAEAPAPPAPETPAEAAAPPAARTAVSEQAGALTEEELARIVEKVAGQVVERLAGTIIEKIAWDVVPDLAESMVQDEIRKIKEALR